MIHLYESQTAPPNRRWIAQYERLKDNLYLTIHGATSEIAEAKARLLLEHQGLDPKQRAAFDLKGRMAALAGQTEEDDLPSPNQRLWTTQDLLAVRSRPMMSLVDEEDDLL